MILFAVSDAGPAKYLASVIIKIDIPFICLCSNISKKVFESYRIHTITEEAQIDYSDIKCIITGTCLGDGLYKIALKKGIKKNILTISIIEHWSLYIERFTLDNKLILPDYILVNDEIAKKESIKSGLPESKIIVVGNPFLEELSVRKLSPKLKSDWHKEIGIKDKPVITFISEIYRDDFPENSPNYQGFDEYEVLNTIIDLAREIDFNVLIRLHPSEDAFKYQKYLNQNVKLDILNDFDSTIMNSDFLVGMGSMFLIEASLFRNDIICYRPNERLPFIGNKLKVTRKVSFKENLRDIFLDKTLIVNERKDQMVGSSDRIIKFINTIYQ